MRVCYLAHITKLKRRRVVDETGIHYPIKEMHIAVNDGFSWNSMTTFFEVRLTQNQYEYIRKEKAHIGTLIQIEGTPSVIGHKNQLCLRNTSFTIAKTYKPRKRRKGA